MSEKSNPLFRPRGPATAPVGSQIHRKYKAVAAVREAVARMDGAGWIDVEAESYPPGAAGWVIVNPRGRCVTPDTLEWEELRHLVEMVAASALTAADAPF